MQSKEQEKRFIKWIHEHKGTLTKVARSFTASDADLEDLYQEILLQVWKSLPAFKDQSSSLTWVYRVSLNRALAWKKKENKRYKLIHILSEEPLKSMNLSIEKKQQIEELYCAIRKLDKPDRALILLSLDGVSYAEIAKIADISSGNVGVRLNRIKKKLSIYLRKG
ncbi:RNA polymerase sigma factor [Puniceicoccaceae bacterium K14]|nr:RNA polymerase sigma factor [Puniceicoccaceae bacterium K14]